MSSEHDLFLKIKPYIVDLLPRVSTSPNGGGVTMAAVNAAIGAHAGIANAHHVAWVQSDTDARYYTKSQLDSGQLDGLYYRQVVADNTFVRLATAGTITARHTFNPPSANSPFILGANAQGQTVVGLRADQLNRTLTAGAGLSGTGVLTADVTLSMGTPSTLSQASANSASGTTHSHAITSSNNPGAAASILASSAAGQLTLPLFVASTTVTTPALTSSAALAITSVGGDISLDASSDVISIGASNLLKSANYASQSTGWGISYAGGGDFRYLFADEMHVKSFIADLEQALAGGQIISKSVAILAIDFTAPAAGATATLRVKDLPSASNMAVFQSGDIVRLRKFSRASGALSISNCWGAVTSYADQSDGTQTWTFTRSTSTNAGAMTAGTVVAADSIVLDYGTSGNGFYEVNAIDGAYAANSPYWQIVSWTGHPATGSSVKARGGKLTGIFSVANEYGLFAGTGTGASDSYLRLSSYTQESNNLSSTWKTGGSTFLSIDATNGVQIESINSLTSSNQRAYSFTIAGAESGGLYHYYNSTYTEAVMMLNQSSASRNNNIFVQTESDSGKNSRIYLEAKETTQATAYIDLQADVGGNASEIQMGAYTISAYTSQILVKYANGSGGDGFASAPVYSFVDDPNTGIYRAGADQLNIATGGALRVAITNASVAIHQNTNNPTYIGYATVGYIGHTGYAGFAHKDQASTTGYALIESSTGVTFLNAATGQKIYLRTGNTDVANVSSSGLRIGDGTTASYPLDVTGTARIGAAAISNSEILGVKGTANAVFSIDSSAGQTGFYHKTSGGGGNNYYIFSDSAGYHFFDNTVFRELFGFNASGDAFFNYTTYVGGGGGATGRNAYFGGDVGLKISSGATCALDINSNQIRLRSTFTPASGSASGNVGTICWDASYIYICTGATTWRRAAHSAF